MSEYNMWQACSQALARHNCHAERIENAVSLGNPDVHICYRGEDVYWEFKHPKMPKKRTSKVQVDVLLSQVHWLANRRRAGGTAWVVVYLKETNTLLAFSDPRTIVALYKNKLTYEQMQGKADFFTKSWANLLTFCWLTIVQLKSIDYGGVRGKP